MSIQLITRGDDAGSCHSADVAIRECCEFGLLRNVSIMVPGPTFKEVPALFVDLPEVCLGLHVTLNAEWEGPRWGPVLPAHQVPSLVDTQGYFLPTPMDLHRRNASVEEMMAEVQAQLDLARQSGLPIAYLDEHMGVGWLPGFRERLAALCQREGLFDAHPIPSLPTVETQTEDIVANWIARTEVATPGTYVLVTHPGRDTEDMRQFGHAGLLPGQVAVERDAERRAWTDTRLREALLQRSIQPIRYIDVPSEHRHTA